MSPKTESSSVPLILEEAKDLFKQRRINEAIALIEGHLASNGESAELQVEYAQLLRIAGRSQEAREVLERVVGRQFNFEASQLLLTCYRDLSLKNEAGRLAKIVIAKDPTNAIGSSVLGWVLLTEGKVEEARALLKTSLEHHPHNSHLVGEMLNCFLEQKEVGAGVEMMESEVEVVPEDSQLRIKLARAYRAAQQFDDALEQVRQAEALSGESVASMHLEGRILADMGNFDEALAIGHHMAERYPTAMWTHKLLAAAYIGLQQYERAAAQIMSVQLVSPIDEESRWMVGESIRNLSRGQSLRLTARYLRGLCIVRLRILGRRGSNYRAPYKL